MSSTYSLVAYNEYINESEVGGVTTGTNVNAEYYFNKGAESPNHVCAILTEIFRTNSKYSIPGIVKNGGGTAPFNFDVMQMDITIISRGRQVAHPQIVEAYNSTSVCGKTNWILSTDYSFVLPAPCGGAGPEAKWPTMKTLNGINPSPAAPEPSYLAVGDFSAGMVQTAYPPRARTDLNMYEVEDCSLPNARRAVRFKYDIPNYKTSQECMALECQPGFYNTGTCVN